MFFLLANGFTLYLLFFLILAIGPAVALMRYVYNLDPLEKEPSGLLSQLILRGVLAAFLAGVLEEVGMSVFGLLSGLDENTLGFELLSDFVVVGVIEEACKYILMSRAVMAIPAHMGFAVLFGMLYGEAKYLAVRGHRIGSVLCVVVGFAFSALLHGLYDATATLANYGDGTFLLVVALIYVIVFLVVRSAARHDKRFA